MPRVRITIPDELLQTAGNRAQELDTSISELFAEAVERYMVATKDSSAGSLRSRSGIPRGSPALTIDIPEALLQSANKVAKRLGKSREVMYCEALARLVAHSPKGPSAIDQGHDLPTAAAPQSATEARQT